MDDIPGKERSQKQEQEPEAEHDPNWKQKPFGIISFEYAQKAVCPITDPFELSRAQRASQIEIEDIAPNEWLDTDLNDMVTKAAIDELTTIHSRKVHQQQKVLPSALYILSFSVHFGDLICVPWPVRNGLQVQE